MSSKLAVYGGSRAIPEGTYKKWPPIDDTDRKMVMASLEGANHAFGPNCQAFEKEFAAWNGNAFAITTNSGTAAIHMGVAACGCGSGDQVLVTAYSWSSSATAIIHHTQTYDAAPKQTVVPVAAPQAAGYVNPYVANPYALASGYPYVTTSTIVEPTSNSAATSDATIVEN